MCLATGQKKTFSIVLGKYVSAMSLDKAWWVSSLNQTGQNRVKGGPGWGWETRRKGAPATMQSHTNPFHASDRDDTALPHDFRHGCTRRAPGNDHSLTAWDCQRVSM